jgi:hypothetical protein
MQQKQKTGTMAVLSIIAAIAAFFFVFSGSPVLGLLLAIIAIPFGIFGLLWAASPTVSGGFISIFGILLGSIGVITAVLGMLGMIIF